MGVQTPEMRLLNERARALYVLGLQPRDIARKIGVGHNTLRQWVTRGKWPAKKLEIQEANITLVEKVTAQTISDVTAQYQNRVKQDVEKHLDRLSEFSPTEAQDFVHASVALKNLDDVGRRNLGLSTEADGSTGKNTFNFNLGTCKPVKKSTNQANSLSDIEVESTQVSENE